MVLVLEVGFSFHLQHGLKKLVMFYPKWNYYCYQEFGIKLANLDYSGYDFYKISTDKEISNQDAQKGTKVSTCTQNPLVGSWEKALVFNSFFYYLFIQQKKKKKLQYITQTLARQYKTKIPCTETFIQEKHQASFFLQENSP